MAPFDPSTRSIPARQEQPSPGAYTGALQRLTGRLRQAVQPPPVAAAPDDSSRVDETRQAMQVLSVAVDIAELLLSSGASANDVTQNSLHVARAFGLRGVHCDVTYTSIHISWQRPDQEPLSTLRVVRTRGTDFTRVQRALQLIREIEAGQMTILESQRRFRRLNHANHPYRGWVVVVANGSVALGLGLLWNASWIVLALSFFAVCLLDLVVTALARRGVPAFFRQVVGAAIPTAVTLASEYAKEQGVMMFTESRPQLIVSAGIILLLAGMSVVGAAQDSLDGFYVTASARAFEVVVLTMGIVTGILLTLGIGSWLGVSVHLMPTAPSLGPGVLQLAGALVISLVFAIACYATWRAVLLCGLLGTVSWGVFMIATHIGFGEIGASAAGAIISAMIAAVLAAHTWVPALVLLTTAIVPLMPGGMVYRGVLMVAEGDTTADTMSGLIMLMTAAGIGLALAAGSSLGTFLARPFLHPRQMARAVAGGVRR